MGNGKIAVAQQAWRHGRSAESAIARFSCVPTASHSSHEAQAVTSMSRSCSAVRVGASMSSHVWLKSCAARAARLAQCH